MADADEFAAGNEQQGTTYDWSAHYDDEGRLFYYNSVTDESSWDPPEEGFNPPSEDPPADMTANEQAGDESTQTPLKSVPGTPPTGTDDGLPDFGGASPKDINDNPSDADEDAKNYESENIAPNEENESTAAWVKYRDDEGREYFYNAETGETQWDQPEHYVDAEELEQSAEGQNATDADGYTREPPVASMESDDDDVGSDRAKTATRADQEDEGESAPDEAPPPEPEEIDPAIKRAQEAEAALNLPDSILEPGCIANVTEVVTSEGGNPQKAITSLIDNYHGQTAICGLLGRWLADLRASASSTTVSSTTQPVSSAALATAAQEEKPSEATADQIREIVQSIVNKIAKERFSKEAGDGILNLSKADAAFLEDMMVSSRWRKLLIDLSASHKDSAVLMYCLREISNAGHHREIARRVNQADHFAVFNAMLTSELAVIGKLAVSAGSDAAASVSQDEVVADLLRACSSTSYTYLYSIEMLRSLEQKAREHLKADQSSRFARAIRKWEALSQNLESAMVNPHSSNSVTGSSPLLRKRRLEVALTLSELHQRQRRRKLVRNGELLEQNHRLNHLETSLLAFLRRHSVGIQLDDAVLDAMLPSGLDLGGDEIGRLLVSHPLAIQALLTHLYKPGTSRLTSPTLKNKCAGLVAFAVLAAERLALEEQGEEGAEPASDEVALTRMIVQGSELCEQLESMVSFLVVADVNKSAALSPGEKLCSVAMKCAPVAQGVILWAKEVTHSPEFATSATFSTLSGSILSLVRLVCIKSPFTRSNALALALNFLGHSNSDISYQKVNSIKEQSLRLLIHLLIHGEVATVLGGITKRLEAKGTSVLDASLVRYFVCGLLEVVSPPTSIVFIRSFGAMLKTARCIDAIRSSYFIDPHRQRLVELITSFEHPNAKANNKNSDDLKLMDEDISMISSLKATYQIA